MDYRRSRAPLLRVSLPIAVALFSSCCPEQWPHEPFSPEAWKQSAWEQRHVYYQSLAESRLLDGASRARVAELLGEPDATHHGAMMYLVRKENWAFLGRHPARLLDIRFDQNGLVESYRIHFN